MGRMTRRLQRQAGRFDMNAMEKIIAHVQRHLGPITNVFHEIGSNGVHVDVHVVGPTPERPFYTLVTTGMSYGPMKRPCEHGINYSYAELVMYLPPDWPLEGRCGQRVPPRPDVYWPVRELQAVAKLPHLENQWLGIGMSIGPSRGEHFPGTEFIATMLLPPADEVPDFETLEISAARRIDFLAVMPMYLTELDFKMLHGPQAMLDLYWERDVSFIADPTRPPVA